MAATLEKSLRRIARHFDGPKGVWAYDAFDVINAEFFDGRLPVPKIQWALTPHGKCLGMTATWLKPVRLKPIITLHPSLFGSVAENPWNIPNGWLGRTYAFDVLLHEMIHVAQRVLYDGGKGSTSHNNTAWIAEVNRLAPMLGFDGLEAGMSVTKRVPVDGQFTKTGKPLTRVARVSEGNVPHGAVSAFPYGIRELRGTAESHYRRLVTCNCVLHGMIPEVYRREAEASK